MTDRFAQIEECLAAGSCTDAASLLLLLQRVRDADWRVQYAAAIALGDRPTPKAIDALLAVLDQEDAAPLYAQADGITGSPAGANFIPEGVFPAGTTPATIEAWRRRGRLKQAICTTLGAIGQADARVLAYLHRYAVDQREDYAVRAAACKALARIASPDSRATLETAVNDQEWCTRTEAQKALRAVLQQS